MFAGANNGTDVLEMSLLAMRLCSERIWHGQISGQASGSVVQNVAETTNQIGQGDGVFAAKPLVTSLCPREKLFKGASGLRGDTPAVKCASSPHTSLTTLKVQQFQQARFCARLSGHWINPQKIRRVR